MSSIIEQSENTQPIWETMSSYEEEYESSPEYPIDCDSTYHARNQAWRDTMIRKIFDECQIYDDDAGDVTDLATATALINKKFDNAGLLEMYHTMFDETEEPPAIATAIQEADVEVTQS